MGRGRSRVPRQVAPDGAGLTGPALVWAPPMVGGSDPVQGCPGGLPTIPRGLPVQQGMVKMKEKSTGLGVRTQVQVLTAPDFFYSVNL